MEQEVSGASAAPTVATHEPRGHTPGPWRFDDDGEVRAYSNDDEFGEELLDNIAVVYGEENGPLIAAAPELLEALVVARDNMRRGVTGREARKGWDMANAAIAKATGAS